MANSFSNTLNSPIHVPVRAASAPNLSFNLPEMASSPSINSLDSSIRALSPAATAPAAPGYQVDDDETINTFEYMSRYIASLPQRARDFHPADSGPDETATLYYDLLDSCVDRAYGVLRALDDVEMKYRRAGLKYHKQPWEVRHSQHRDHALSNLSLAIVFETDKCRAEQNFFTEWYNVAGVAEKMLRIDGRWWGVEDVDELRALLSGMEARLDAVEQKVVKIQERMFFVTKAVVRMVTVEMEKRGWLYEIDLRVKGRREGNLVRNWVCTLDEIWSVKGRSGAVEVVLEEWLEKNVATGVWWSKGTKYREHR